MTQAEPECVAHLVIHASSWTWVCSSFGYSWLKLNLSVQLIWLFMTQAEPEYVAHLVIHDSSWTWVRTSFGYSWLKLNLSVYLIWLFMTQAEPECVPHLVIHASSWTWVCSSFVCLYNYEFGLSLCKIVRSSVILLLPLFIIII